MSDRLLFSPPSHRIDVSTDNGIVTLSGSANNLLAKLQAKNTAESVKGVIAVISNILVRPTPRLDSQIYSDVISALALDPVTKLYRIDVSMTTGIVTLEGEVGSHTERQAAEDVAQEVRGVVSVENQLDVTWWADVETSDWADGWTDEDMKQAVENALLTNPRVNPFTIATSVNNGVARLIGTVDNVRAKRQAEREALGTLGVSRVKNHLRVRPFIDRADNEIASDVHDALRRNPYVERYDIVVTTVNGRVVLLGNVDSWHMKDQAEKAVAAVTGVVDIQNNLSVTYQPTAKSDAEIKEDIESQLWWSPFVDSDDIELARLSRAGRVGEIVAILNVQLLVELPDSLGPQSGNVQQFAQGTRQIPFQLLQLLQASGLYDFPDLLGHALTDGGKLAQVLPLPDDGTVCSAPDSLTNSAPVRGFIASRVALGTGWYLASSPASAGPERGRNILSRHLDRMSRWCASGAACPTARRDAALVGIGLARGVVGGEIRHGPTIRSLERGLRAGKVAEGADRDWRIEAGYHLYSRETVSHVS